MSLATPCCAGRAAICLPSGPLPTDDLSHLCALPLTTATHPTTSHADTCCPSPCPGQHPPCHVHPPTDPMLGTPPHSSR